MQTFFKSTRCALFDQVTVVDHILKYTVVFHAHVEQTECAMWATLLSIAFFYTSFLHTLYFFLEIKYLPCQWEDIFIIFKYK